MNELESRRIANRFMPAVTFESAQAVSGRFADACAFSAPLKIFQRIVPLLVTVEITDRPWRLLFTRTTGVWPWGA